MLRPNPWKWIGVGLGCLVFTIIGIWMIINGEMIGWLSLLFFGILLLTSIVYMLPNASYLKLESDGFTTCSMFRACKVRWADVTTFVVGRVFPNKMVMFNFEPTYSRTQKLRAFNVGLVGFEASLPDNYGLKAEELAELLNKFKQASLHKT